MMDGQQGYEKHLMATHNIS